MRKRIFEASEERRPKKFRPGQEFEFEIAKECDIRYIDGFIEEEVSRVLKVEVIIPVGASGYDFERDKDLGEEGYRFYYSASFEGVGEYEDLYGDVYVGGFWTEDMEDDIVYLGSGTIVIKEA
jgi:hypothetical protein